MGLNLNRVKGFLSSDEDTSTLEEMNKTLHDMNEQSKKMANLNLAGLLGGPLINNTPAPGQESTDAIVSDSGFGKKVYEEVIVDGEKMVAETNEKTGKINNLLTIEEAQKRGIVDEHGKIYSNLTQENSKFDQITADLDHQEGVVKLTTAQIANLATGAYEGVLAQQKINETSEEVINVLIDRFDLNKTGKTITDNATVESAERIVAQLHLMNKGFNFIDQIQKESGMGQFFSTLTDVTRAIVQNNQSKPIKFVDILMGGDSP